MYAESRKIQLIEDVLKVEDDFILSELETILKKSRTTSRIKKKTIYDFVGILSKRKPMK